MFFIKERAEDRKALDSVALDMREISDLCDYFFICGADSTRQAKAIADGIIDPLKQEDIRPMHVEGYNEGQWILLDYNSVMAHIFCGETRSFYKLERLWGDAPRVIFTPPVARSSKKAVPGLRRPKRSRCKKISSKRKSLS